MRAAIVPGVALLAAFAAAPLGAQRPPQRGPAEIAARQQRADSARAVREARGAQAEFERQRVRHLPFTDRGRATVDRCDEIIGRFCLWYDREGDNWTPPPEPEPVTRARARVVERLDSAALRAPGDEWIAGQRVRYLVEAGRMDEARAAADACRARGWWCRALAGYAAHTAGAYGAADSAFTGALAEMPERERREWLDLAPILAGDDARALRRMEPAEREAAVRRLWWLSDPLWMEPGNDRKTEHFTRLVHDRMQDRARTPEGISWGDDLREITLRYGRPIGWEKIRPQAWHTGSPPDLVIHHAPHGREFIPRMDRDAPLGATPPSGERFTDYRARSSYSPPGVARMDTLAHQLALFRRGDSAVVVAGLVLEGDSLPANPRMEAGLVLAASDTSAVWMRTERVEGARAALRVTAPMHATVFSVEAREVGSRLAGRARYPLPAPGPAAAVGLSDILLLADAASRPATLDEAAPLARPGTRFRAGERVGLFWEVYRAAPAADTMRLSLGLARRAPGSARRIAERIGLAASAQPVRIRWAEEAGAAPLLARSTTVALPRRLPPGEYLLEVTVHPASGPPATTTRAITIVR